MAELPLRLGNRIILTIGRAAARYGFRDSKAAQTAIARLGVQPVMVPGPFGPEAVIDGRTPVYWQSELDAAMRARPGKGRRAAT